MYLQNQLKKIPVYQEGLLEKVILQNDLMGLSPLEKVEHIKHICESLGLNPLTKPIQLHKFNGREIMYIGKDGTEQLRNLHNVSITKLETEIMPGDLYMVKAHAEKPSGRKDCSTSAVMIGGLRGEVLSNAMKKCETQAKRRVTLSICGLGILEESEFEDLPEKLKYKISESPKQESLDTPLDWVEVNNLLVHIQRAASMDELETVFKNGYKISAQARDHSALKKIIDAKDVRKAQLELEKVEVETEEVSHDVTL